MEAQQERSLRRLLRRLLCAQVKGWRASVPQPASARRRGQSTRSRRHPIGPDSELKNEKAEGEHYDEREA